MCECVCIVLCTPCPNGFKKHLRNGSEEIFPKKEKRMLFRIGAALLLQRVLSRYVVETCCSGIQPHTACPPRRLSFMLKNSGMCKSDIATHVMLSLIKNPSLSFCTDQSFLRECIASLYIHCWDDAQGACSARGRAQNSKPRVLATHPAQQRCSVPGAHAGLPPSSPSCRFEDFSVCCRGEYVDT